MHPKVRTRPGLPYSLPAVALIAAAMGYFAPVNPVLWDVINRLQPGQLAPQERAVVVGIDAQSLQDYGRLSGWPRSLYAQAVQQLQDAGASAIGLDIVFSDPSPEDAELSDTFSAPNVTLALPPEGELLALLQLGWKSPQAVSALPSGFDGVVRQYQTGYPLPGGDLLPSLAWQVAEQAGGSPL
ncbi:CHASE2 domain-containing protein [Deinococcus lacus]|uniref:CHASE2 domain-containing protein n=1 Tax=Deinococcus lacus TaxID=392561 RepID=A0ABW1YBL9_9DEIO